MFWGFLLFLAWFFQALFDYKVRLRAATGVCPASAPAPATTTNVAITDGGSAGRLLADFFSSVRGLLAQNAAAAAENGPLLGGDGLGHECLCRRGTPPGREPGEACWPHEFNIPERWPPGDVWRPSYVVVWEGLMPLKFLCRLAWRAMNRSVMIISEHTEYLY
ncbi:hypothetical protein J3E69DRAFT_351961 [Trichoderma sp. SZMC 28015]